MKNPKIIVALGALSAVVGMVLFTFSPTGEKMSDVSVSVVNLVGFLLMFIGVFFILPPPQSPPKS